MENAELAGYFHKIADLLEIKGENPFRIRSYRNAGLIIEGFPQSFATLLGMGEEHLTGIHGIGDSIREKIIEILVSNRCAFLEDLLKELPAGILEMLKVSGVGPKKAAVLYKELGITSVEGLEKAAKGQKLQGLPGFGEKTEAKILKAIGDLKAMSGKFKLSVAMKHADTFVAHLKGVAGVDDVVPAGSLRRWKETVGDLDILAACADPSKVMEAFVTHPDVKDVVSKGDTKSTVVLKTGLQVDLRVIDKKCFGAALQYFTGSKSHNIHLRDRAKKMGLKISEYGVFSEKGGKEKWVAGKTEEDVYKAVNLPYIPPELREARGEIEAAEKGTLPVELDVKDIRGDLHVHTTESDGTYSMEDMAEAAMKLGYEYIAITDHSKAVGIAHGLDEKRVLAELRAVDGFNERMKKKGKKFMLLKGAEVDIRADGTLDHPDSVLDKLDCVVAAVHSGFGMEEAGMTARIINAIRTGKVNVLAHPTGRLIGAREPYKVNMEKVMDEAKKYNVAMEINSYPDRLDLNDVHAMLAKEKGVMVAISTDSHSVYHLENIQYGIHTARRGWLEKKDILNTRTLKELLKILKKGR